MLTWRAHVPPVRYGGIGPGIGQTEVELVDGIVQCRFVPTQGRLGVIQETACLYLRALARLDGQSVIAAAMPCERSV